MKPSPTMAGSLIDGLRAQLDARRIARLREIETELADIYAADPETVRLLEELARRLGEPIDFILNGIAIACAGERLVDEEIRTELRAPTDPDALRARFREAARPSDFQPARKGPIR